MGLTENDYPKPCPFIGFEDDPFTMGMQLCDDDGIVRRGAMHHGTDYPCTAHAHYAGQHIECMSPAHAVDALPERPERITDPMPEELERLLRDPEIAVSQDLAVHRTLRAHLQTHPDATITRNAYLNLWALIERFGPRLPPDPPRSL